MNFNPAVKTLSHKLYLDSKVNFGDETVGTTPASAADILKLCQSEAEVAQWLAKLFTARGFEVKLSTKLTRGVDLDTAHGLQVFLPNFYKKVLLSIPRVTLALEMLPALRKALGEETSLFFPPAIPIVGDGANARVVHLLRRYRQDTIITQDFGDIFEIGETSLSSTSGWALFDVHGNELARIRDGSTNMHREDLSSAILHINENGTALYPSYQGNALVRVKALLDAQAQARARKAHLDQKVNDAETIQVAESSSGTTFMASGCVSGAPHTPVSETREFRRDPAPQATAAIKALDEVLKAADDTKKLLPSEQYRGTLTKQKSEATLPLLSKLTIEGSPVSPRTEPDGVAPITAVRADVPLTAQGKIEHNALSEAIPLYKVMGIDGIKSKALEPLLPPELRLGNQIAKLLGMIEVSDFLKPGEIVRIEIGDQTDEFSATCSVIRDVMVVYTDRELVTSGPRTFAFGMIEDKLYAIETIKTNQPDTRREDDAACQGT